MRARDSDAFGGLASAADVPGVRNLDHRCRDQVPDPLDNEAVCDLEPIVVDQPADALQHGGLRFEGGRIAQQRSRLLE
jgi:hypothetical protein